MEWDDESMEPLCFQTLLDIVNRCCLYIYGCVHYMCTAVHSAMLVCVCVNACAFVCVCAINMAVYVWLCVLHVHSAMLVYVCLCVCVCVCVCAITMGSCLGAWERF